MFDGNGNWTSDFSAQADRDNGIKILAGRFDNIFIADIKESFENCLTKDGQIAPIGNFNMGGQKITNLNNGVNDNDAVNMSQLNTKVSLTGDETIGGDKTFQTDKLYKKSTQDFITTPAQPYYTEIRNVDINNFEIGQFRVWKDTDGANVIDLLGRYQDNSVNLYGAVLGIRSYSDGRSFPYASASDVNNSVVTTEGINKSENGYVKLGNGLIIQWGTATCNSGNNNISFPTAFSNTNYRIVSNLISSTNNSGSGAANSIYNKSTTGCIIQVRAYPGVGIGAVSSEWLAIGY